MREPRLQHSSQHCYAYMLSIISASFGPLSTKMIFFWVMGSMNGRTACRSTLHRAQMLQVSSVWSKPYIRGHTTVSPPHLPRERKEHGCVVADCQAQPLRVVILKDVVAGHGYLRSHGQH